MYATSSLLPLYVNVQIYTYDSSFFCRRISISYVKLLVHSLSANPIKDGGAESRLPTETILNSFSYAARNDARVFGLHDL